MFSRLTLTQKAFFWVALVLLAQFVFVVMLAALYGRTEKQVKAGSHDQLVIEHLNKISNLWSKLGIELPRSLASPGLEESPVASVVGEIRSEFDELRSLSDGDSAESSDIDGLISVTNMATDAIARAKDAWYEHDVKRFVQCQDEIVRWSDDATTRSNKLLSSLRQSQSEHQLEKDKLAGALNTVLFNGIGANVAIALFTAYAFIAIIVGKTERISHNMVRLLNGVPLNPPLAGNDEIARLDRTFRQMADSLADAERKERALVEDARDVICTLDKDGIFVSVNPAARTMLGHDPDWLIGRLFFDFIASAEQKRVRTLLQNLTVSPEPAVRLQTRLAKGDPDATITPVLLAATWSAADQSMYCVLHDISERWQIQRMKRQFVAMITHDLRTPLNSIMNTFDSIEEGIYMPSSPKGVLRLQESVKNIDRMIQLLDDLLSLVSVDTASISVELKPVSLKELLLESVGSVYAYAEQGGVTLETDLVDATIMADRLRMVQVIVNLLSNAIKFSANGSAVTVRSRIDPHMARIEVQDHGLGISETDQSAIFQPYQQAQSGPRNIQLKGTGLGLTVCKTIVEAHGGRIGVNSKEGVGSTFWLETPLHRDHG